MGLVAVAAPCERTNTRAGRRTAIARSGGIANIVLVAAVAIVAAALLPHLFP